MRVALFQIIDAGGTYFCGAKTLTNVSSFEDAYKKFFVDDENRRCRSTTYRIYCPATDESRTVKFKPPEPASVWVMK